MPFDRINEYVWIRKITPDNVQNFEQFNRENNYANFTITELAPNSNINVVPVSNRPVYWPVMFDVNLTYYRENKNYISPLVGFDLGSFNTTREYIASIEMRTEIVVLYNISVFGLSVFAPNNFNIIMTKFMQIDNTNITTGAAVVITTASYMLDFLLYDISYPISRNDVDIFIVDDTDSDFSPIIYKESNPSYDCLMVKSDLSRVKSLLYQKVIFFDRIWCMYFKFSDSFFNSFRSQVVYVVPCLIAIICLLINIMVIFVFHTIKKIKSYASIEKNGRFAANQMLSYVNHEVRNPLNVVKGYLVLSLKTLNDAKSNITLPKNNAEVITIDKSIYDTIVDNLSTASSNSDLIEHIVSDILTLRKLESNKLEFTNKPVHLSLFFDDIIKTIAQKIEEKQTLELHTIYDKNLIINIDPNRLKQILLNYLTNSIKFTNSGIITIKADFIENRNFRLSVGDTGLGIADKNKLQIFQPFININTNDMRHGSNGLGLYLCKLLAERMSGTVGFCSKLNEGSIFWIDFSSNVINNTEAFINNTEAVKEASEIV